MSFVFKSALRYFKYEIPEKRQAHRGRRGEGAGENRDVRQGQEGERVADRHTQGHRPDKEGWRQFLAGLPYHRFSRSRQGMALAQEEGGPVLRRGRESQARSCRRQGRFEG